MPCFGFSDETLDQAHRPNECRCEEGIGEERPNRLRSRRSRTEVKPMHYIPSSVGDDDDELRAESFAMNGVVGSVREIAYCGSTKEGEVAVI